jgi:hypothetical protein
MAAGSRKRSALATIPRTHLRAARASSRWGAFRRAEASPPARLADLRATQRLAAQRPATGLTGAARIDRKALVAARTGAAEFFCRGPILMALAGRRASAGTLLGPLASAARLLPPPRPARSGAPIPLSRLPARPPPRRLAAGLAAISRQRMRGAEPPLASLQETPSPARLMTAATRAGATLPRRRRREMLRKAQGSRQLPKGQVSEGR